MTRRTIHLTITLLITSILLTLTFLTTAQDDGSDTAFSCDDAQHPIECEALVAIYNATGGENWDNSDDWLEDADVCMWYGITCDDNGQVSEIDFEGNNLFGDLPPEIGNLSNLKMLDVSGNMLTSLPPEIGNLSSLQSLYVSYNDLTSLPPETDNLNNLEVLWVDGNELTSLPVKIDNLSNLQWLNIRDNPLTCIPEGVAHLVDDLPVCEE